MAAPVFVADEIVTAAKLNSLPKGVLGFKKVDVAQGSITAAVDLTNVSVAVTVEATRLICVEVFLILSVASATAATTVIGLVKEGSTSLGEFVRFRTGAAGTVVVGFTQPVFIESPTAGAHTYKLNLEVNGAGTGNVTGSRLAVIDLGRDPNV